MDETLLLPTNALDPAQHSIRPAAGLPTTPSSAPSDANPRAALLSMRHEPSETL